MCSPDSYGMKRSRAFTGTAQTGASKHDRHGLALRHALLVKQAEHWLQLGEPAQALDQLKTLPSSAENNCWAVKVQVAAIHAAREQGIFG